MRTFCHPVSSSAPACYHCHMVHGKRYREAIDNIQKKIQLDCLIIGACLPFDVYLREGGRVHLLFKEGMRYTNCEKDILHGKNISEIYFDEKDARDAEQFISEGDEEDRVNVVDPVVFSRYDEEKEDYHQVERSLLVPGADIDFSVYVLNNMKISPVLELADSQSAKIGPELVQAYGDILIKKADLPKYTEYMHTMAKRIESLPSRDAEKVTSLVIRENSKLIIKDLIDDPRSGRKIKEVDREVNNIIDTILKNKDTIYDLIDLSKYDYYTYTHSVDVAVMSIGLATAINMDREHVEKLGIGAMLHDLGKSMVDHEILNKQGGLNSYEFQVIKKHVIEGNNILSVQKDFPRESFPAVLQHHEKLTGNGYPLGVAGKDITLFGRITSIVDCYDALTTCRPYKKAFTPYYALELLVKQKKDFDCDILREFIRMLGRLQKA
ncbi:MAG: HD-GYP domain-containing protein [Nitrospirae bacterium]|nr:HD-GYP domain-containing protein [Nitrospirota bacterium]